MKRGGAEQPTQSDRDSLCGLVAVSVSRAVKFIEMGVDAFFTVLIIRRLSTTGKLLEASKRRVGGSFRWFAVVSAAVL